MAETRVERRLAAILAADVVGYSRLMGQDEEGTLAALKTCQRDIIDPRIKENRGRIVKTMGDGFLAEFASAVDAARCALDIQGAMARQNATISNDRRIDLCIGINVGDIILDEGDDYGDGVNIAARVEPLAEPGSVYLTENAYQQIRGKLALKVSELGKRQLKNIAQPIGIYRVDGGEGALPVTKQRVGFPPAHIAQTRWRLAAAFAVAALLASAAIAWWQPWVGGEVPAPPARTAHPLPGEPSIAPADRRRNVSQIGFNAVTQRRSLSRQIGMSFHCHILWCGLSPSRPPM